MTPKADPMNNDKALEALNRLQRGHNHFGGNPSGSSLDRLDFETIRTALQGSVGRAEIMKLLRKNPNAYVHDILEILDASPPPSKEEA